MLDSSDQLKYVLGCHRSGNCQGRKKSSGNFILSQGKCKYFWKKVRKIKIM